MRTPAMAPGVAALMLIPCRVRGRRDPPERRGKRGGPPRRRGAAKYMHPYCALRTATRRDSWRRGRRRAGPGMDALCLFAFWQSPRRDQAGQALDVRRRLQRLRRLWRPAPGFAPVIAAGARAAAPFPFAPATASRAFLADSALLAASARGVRAMGAPLASLGVYVETPAFRQRSVALLRSASMPPSL